MYYTIIHIQSDPDLPGYSGERVLPGKSGYPVYRGGVKHRVSGKSGPGKSGSDCNYCPLCVYLGLVVTRPCQLSLNKNNC